MSEETSFTGTWVPPEVAYTKGGHRYVIPGHFKLIPDDLNTLRCIKCGNEHLDILASVDARYTTKDGVRIGENGELVFEYADEPAEPIWDTSEDIGVVCSECGWAYLFEKDE